MRAIAWNLNHRARRRRIPDWVVAAIAAQTPHVIVLTEYVEGPDHEQFIAGLGSVGLTHCEISERQKGHNQLLIAATAWRNLLAVVGSTPCRHRAIAGNMARRVVSGSWITRSLAGHWCLRMLSTPGRSTC